MTDEYRIETIVDRIGLDEVVLDVGCVRHDEERRERANLHDRLTDAAGHIVGIDFVEAEVEKMAAEGYDVKTGDAERLGVVEFANSSMWWSPGNSSNTCPIQGSSWMVVTTHRIQTVV